MDQHEDIIYYHYRWLSPIRVVVIKYIIYHQYRKLMCLDNKRYLTWPKWQTIDERKIWTQYIKHCMWKYINVKDEYGSRGWYHNLDSTLLHNFTQFGPPNVQIKILNYFQSPPAMPKLHNSTSNNNNSITTTTSTGHTSITTEFYCDVTLRSEHTCCSCVFNIIIFYLDAYEWLLYHSY